MDARGIVQAMPLGVFLAALGFALAMAGVCVAAARRAWSRARLARALETTPLGAAPNGYVALEGRAEAIDGRALDAPLTGARCVWYRARVEAWVDRPSDSRRLPGLPWKTVRERTSEEAFLLRDASGVCLVLPRGADVTPTDRSVWTGPTIDPAERAPPRFGPTESPEGMLRSGGGPNARFRYSEERIFAGDPLFATGVLARRTGGNEEISRDTGGTAKGSLPDRRLGSDPAGRPFLLSTTPRSAQVELDELGAKAALWIAVAPLGLVALLALFRWG